jgi:hypothetical protein
MVEYSFDLFIESLRPHKRGRITHLIEAYSDIEYGYIWEWGPIVYIDIHGWMGEHVRALKIFGKEFSW